MYYYGTFNTSYLTQPNMWVQPTHGRLQVKCFGCETMFVTATHMMCTAVYQV